MVFTGAATCRPCAKQRQELSALLATESIARSLFVLEAGADNLDAHRAFRIRYVPSLALIDANGTLARLLVGSQATQRLRTELQAVGVSLA